MNYFICIVRQNENTYLFDASNFIENCIRYHGVIDNPFTRQPIGNFEIFVSSKEAPEFKLHMTREEVITPPNHLPILWSDPSRERSDCFIFMLKYGKHFETKDIDRTIQVYEEAAKMGCSEAMLRLVSKYKILGQKEFAIAWLRKCLSCLELRIKDVFFCAHNFESFQDHQGAFKAYKLAAEKRNMIGLGEVILHLEQGKGVEKDLEGAANWRQQLPEGWRHRPISEFFNHLSEIKYDYSREGYP